MSRFFVLALSLILPFAVSASPNAASFPSARVPKNVPSAQEVLNAITPILRGQPGKGNFSSKACPRPQKTALAALLLMDTPMIVAPTFLAGCDLEGNITVVREPFPAEVKLRNVPKVDRAKATVSVEVEPEGMNSLRVDFFAKNGELYSAAGITRFESNYSIRLDLSGQVKENLGGKIRLTEHAGHPVNLSEPLKFDLDLKRE